jgi:hypothetical protein
MWSSIAPEVFSPSSSVSSCRRSRPRRLAARMSALPRTMVPSREIEAVVAAGDESRDMALATLATAAEPADSATAIQRLVAGVTVRRTASGGLVIEAPPETAATLGALLSEWQCGSRPPPHRRLKGSRSARSTAGIGSARSIAQENCRRRPMGRKQRASAAMPISARPSQCVVSGPLSLSSSD